MRIALIHAHKHSIVPVETAFARLWPEARTTNLLDDSLSADLARQGSLDDAMTDRFLSLARYQKACSADAILFTCSAFGPCIEACADDLSPVPVLKPNEAAIEEAVALSGPTGTIGLMSTFPPTLKSMPPEFAAVAPGVKLVPNLVEGALAALDKGDVATHDRLVAAASVALKGCDVIVLSQFSLAHTHTLVAEATGRPVITTPDSAVRKLRRALNA